MEKVFNFLGDNYLIFLGVSIVLLIALIGFMASGKKKQKNASVQVADTPAQPNFMDNPQVPNNGVNQMNNVTTSFVNEPTQTLNQMPNVGVQETMQPVTPVATQTLEVPQVPTPMETAVSSEPTLVIDEPNAIPVSQEVPSEPVLSVMPEVQAAPQTPVAPVMPEVQTVPQTPVAPVMPEVQTVPQAPVAPVMPEVQTVPQAPVAPVMPEVQAVPQTPVAPVMPEVQTVPQTPVAPAMPKVQTVPQAPVMPAMPEVQVAQPTGSIFETPNQNQ